MAIRAKTPSTPAKRSKTKSDQDAPAAPAKTKARRNGSATKQAQEPSAPASEAPADLPVQEQTFEAPSELAERPPAPAEASAQREDRASRALDAIKTLGEMIAEGIGTLADLRAEMRQMSGRLDQLAADRPSPMAAGPNNQQTEVAGAADDYQIGRDRDPGDAVPPGVAVMSPTSLTKTDEAALHSLEELPRRAGRTGKRGPRAKQ